nr:hypothetical protein [Tanacetum cinerariifolium]
MDDSLESAATTATSLDAEQDRGGGPRCQEAIGDTIAQTRSENVFGFSNDPLLTGVNIPQSGEDSLKLNELMELCTKLQQRVLDLETTKTTQAMEIKGLKRRVKKLERRKRSRTHKLKRLYKVGLSVRVEYSEDEGLGKEDASKQGRITDIDFNEDIYLVNVHKDKYIFGVTDSNGDEVIVKDPKMLFDVADDLRGEDVFVLQEVPLKEASVIDEVNAVSTATTTTTTIDDITLAKALMEIKSAKPKTTAASTRPKAKGIVIHDQEEAPTPTVSSQQLSHSSTKEYHEYLFEKHGWIETKKFEEKYFDEIQELFDKAMKRVNTFVDFRTELVEESSKKAEAEITQEGSSKRAGDELEQERSKKQKVEDDKESEELKRCLKITPNDEDDVTIDATPFKMLKFFDREDLKVIWRLVKARFKKKNQQGLVKVKNWKLYDSCGVHCVTLQNILYYMLVKKMYLLTNHTLHQMFNDVKLQVDYECETTFELLRLKFKEDLFTSGIENRILQDSSEPSNDNTNVVNALREPFIFNQDPGKNSSQSPPQINHHCCYGCGDPLEGIFCHEKRCKLCGNGAHYGYNCLPKVSIILNPEPFNNQTIQELPPTVQSFDPKSDLVHDSPNVFEPPPQLPFYSCKFCGNDARYGHYCTPQVPFVYPEPCYNQDFNFSQESQNFQQQYLCCENYEVTHEAYQCQPINADYYHEQNSCYDPNSFGFDQFQPQQFIVNHPIFNVQNDLFDSQNKLMEQLTSMCDMVGQFIQKKEEEKRIKEEQAANARYWKIPACYDDDDDDYAFAITPNEPVNSLSMGDEHLDTIPAMKSDEFIKSSIENLVPNLSESEGENECDVPSYEVFTTFSNILFDSDYDFYSSDDQSFFDEDFLKEIYSNPLFDEEIISMKIDPHPFNVESDLIESLLNHDSSIISSLKIDSLFDEFAVELTLLKSIPLGIDKTDCDPEEETHFVKRLLYDNSSLRLPKEFVSENSDAEIESFSPSPIPVEDSDSLMDEIDLSFTLDYPMSPGIKEDDYDSERDTLILEELLSNNSLSHPKNESFHFDIPSFFRPPTKPPDGNTGILNVKMMGDISEQKVPMPRLMITLVPNQEKSLDLLSHLGHEAFQPSAEGPMMIYGKNTPILDVPLFHFYPP